MRLGHLKNALKSLKKIAVHARIHLDEVVAIWILRKYGGDLISHILEVGVFVWKNGNSTPDGRSARKWIEEGVLPIGVGSGPFDEHAVDGKGQRLCSAELVANFLGVLNNPELRQILKIVRDDDVYGSSKPDQLGPLVLALSNQWPDNPEAVINHVSILLDALHQRQCDFLSARKEIQRIQKEVKESEEFDFRSQVIPIGEDRVRLVAVQSNNNQLVNAGRSLGYDVVVQESLDGHVQVHLFDKVYPDEVDLVAHRIRFNEARSNGLEDKARRMNLRLDGVLTAIPEWFYQRNAGRIMNGSLSAPDVPVTSLSQKDVVAITASALRRKVQKEKVRKVIA